MGEQITGRLVVPEAEEQLYRTQEVSRGELILTDYKGGDELIARVATAGHGSTIFPERPGRQEFLDHLVASGITDPFRFTHVQLRITSPIAVALRLVYEKDISVNEYSMRYSAPMGVRDGFTTEEHVHEFAQRLARHGITDRGFTAKTAILFMREAQDQGFDAYHSFINDDVARELSRQVLDTNVMTRYMWKNDLLHTAQLVQNARKQYEPGDPTLSFIERIGTIAESIAPDAWRALLHPQPKKLQLTPPTDDAIVDGKLCAQHWDSAPTKRSVVPALEAILYQERSFLSNGAVQPVEYMGDAHAAVDAARTSYGVGTKRSRADDALIAYLMRHHHNTPIEMPELHWEFKSPLFIEPRQSGRHRTIDSHGFMGVWPIGSESYDAPDDQVRSQSSTNKQGRGMPLADDRVRAFHERCRDAADTQREIAVVLRNLGVPESDVRTIKGVGFATRGSRSGDAHNIMHFLRLRVDSHAQWETQEYAREVMHLFRTHNPVIAEGFDTYRRNSITLHADDIAQLRDWGLNIRPDVDVRDPAAYNSDAWREQTEEGDEQVKLARIARELLDKLDRIRNP